MRNLLVILLCLLLNINYLYSQTRFEVSGAGRSYPIAIAELCQLNPSDSVAKEVPKIFAKNFDLTGYFNVINPSSYIETPGKCDDESFAYSDWSSIGVEGLIKGKVQSSGSKYKIKLFLHDVGIEKEIFGKEYTVDKQNINKAVYSFGNDVVKHFTGTPGIFGSKIVFSGKVGRFKELYMMNLDGSKLKQLTSDRGLAISASWGYNKKDIVYTSYKNRNPDLFLLNASNLGTKSITNGSALDIGGKFHPSTNQFLLSQTTGKDSDIVTVNSSGKIISSFNKGNGAIDVSPDYSPDGSSIVFCSNRGGGPQIYTMDTYGSNVKRVSYTNSNYCTSPVWSTTGNKLAFVCRANGGFQLFVTNTDGSEPLQLTNSGQNEDPSWSPDGKYLVFSKNFSSSNNSLAIIRADGQNLKRLTKGSSGESDPSWSKIVF